MKKRSKVVSSARKVRDRVLEEFETKDLGDDIEASGGGVLIYPRGMATSIKLSPQLVAKLREKGRKRGIGYQTMLKIIVNEHVDEY